MASDSEKIEKKPVKPPSKKDIKEIVNGFENLRKEQRSLAMKLSEFEADLKEHKMVIATLKNVSEDRRCFRLIGGVLIEKQVKDVLPALIENVLKLQELIDSFKERITKKGEEINEYREKNNITFRFLDNSKIDEDQPVKSTESRGNVLVS